MLDVHPPHHPTHNWRDFFVHIATITVGLLIAVGLEQAVEILHHREQVRYAREELAQERGKNMKLFALETRTLEHSTPVYLTDQTVLRFLREHPGAPPEQWPGTLAWYASEIPFVSASWTAVQRGTVIEHLSREELEEATELYERLAEVRSAEVKERDIAQEAGGLFASTGGLKHASPEELNQLISDTNELLVAHARIGMEMNRLHRRFPAFAPSPTTGPLSEILGTGVMDPVTAEFTKEFMAISGHYGANAGK